MSKIAASTGVKNKSEEYRKKLNSWIELMKKISCSKVYTTVSDMKAYLFGTKEDWLEELFVVHHRVKQEKQDVGPDVIAYFKTGNRCLLQYDDEFNIKSLDTRPRFMHAININKEGPWLKEVIDEFETDWERGFQIMKQYAKSVESTDADSLPPPYGLK